MKIKMRVHCAGPEFSASPGDEIERPDDEAMNLIKNGYAVPMTAVAVETAVEAPIIETRQEVAAEPAQKPVPEDGDGLQRRGGRRGRRG